MTTSRNINRMNRQELVSRATAEGVRMDFSVMTKPEIIEAIGGAGLVRISSMTRVSAEIFATMRTGMSGSEYESQRRRELRGTIHGW